LHSDFKLNTTIIIINIQGSFTRWSVTYCFPGGESDVGDELGAG
jgi:hypothetical protein